MNVSSTQRNAGFLTFFISGICAISSGIIVSLLQDCYGFAYSMTGSLLSLMNVGNLIAGFAAGVLPGLIGMKPAILILTSGYCLGYLLMGISGWPLLLMTAFFLTGLAKGSTINICTILVSDHSKNRTRGMNIMHSCYATGALLCPFLLGAASGIKPLLPLFALSVCGLILWIVFALSSLETAQTGKKGSAGWDFLKNKKFWLLTGLLFFQNAAEFGVNGWMVTYFKGSGIISQALSPYTVTVMWTATLIGRLLIAFVFPLKNPRSAMIRMGIGCTVFYALLMTAKSQTAAIILLAAFAFSMAGMNPTAVASAGKMTTVTSMGVMLPAASSGAILMPWLIGLVAQDAGLKTGMAVNIISCVGMLLFSILINRLEDGETAA